MAPELFVKGAQASKEADMYAFGMVIYEVITGTRPFGDRKVVELPALTVQGWRPPIPEDPVAVGFCQGTWEFVERCWDEHPEQRPTVGHAVEHFERAARSSTVVDPSPTVSVEIVDPRREDSAKNLCQSHNPTRCLYSDSAPANLFAQPSTSGTRRLRQTAYATRVLVSNRSVPVPTWRAGGEANLLRRVFRPLIPPRPAPRLGLSP